MVQPWNRVLVPPRDICNDSFQFFCRTKAPTKVEDDNFRLSLRFLEHHPVTSSPTHQKKPGHSQSKEDSDSVPKWSTVINMTFLLLKNLNVEQNLWNCFWDMSPPFPQVGSLFSNVLFPFLPSPVSQGLLSSSEHPSPSSATV